MDIREQGSRRHVVRLAGGPEQRDSIRWAVILAEVIQDQMGEIETEKHEKLFPAPLPLAQAEQETDGDGEQERQPARVTEPMVESVGVAGHQTRQEIQIRRIRREDVPGDDLAACHAINLRRDLVGDQSCKGMTDRGWH